MNSRSLFVLLLILLTLLILITRNVESYTDAPLLIFDTNLNPYVINIIADQYNESSILKTKIKNIRNVSLNNNVKPSSLQIYIDDALSFSMNKNSKKVLTLFDDEKVMFFIKPKDNNPNLSLLDTGENFVFGYVNDIELVIMKILLRGLEVDPQKFNTKKVSINDTINEKWFKSNQITALLCFTSLSNEWYLQRFDKTFVIDVLSYENIQPDIIKFYAPFAKLKAIDISQYLNIFKETNKVQFVIAFDMLLYGDPIIERQEKLRSVLYTLIVNLGAIDILNYYSMYFPLFDHTLRYLKKSNHLIMTRNSRPILEQFNVESFEAQSNIQGFYDSKAKLLSISSDTIDTFKLQVNMKVKLNKQEREEENGDYTVVLVSPKKTLLQQIWKKISTIEDPFKDPRYECYGKQDIKSMGLCESEYDTTGLRKKPVYQWDRRCETNEECPFYQANKNYKNYFGGCVDGFCQLPLGLEKASFRKANDNSKPICYNCKDPLDPFCCDEQKDISKYPHLSSPDYAFPLDSYERWKQLQTKKVKWFNILSLQK